MLAMQNISSKELFNIKNVFYLSESKNKCLNIYTLLVLQWNSHNSYSVLRCSHFHPRGPRFESGLLNFLNYLLNPLGF